MALYQSTEKQRRGGKMGVGNVRGSVILGLK
jgi:hypothetical protein